MLDKQIRFLSMFIAIDELSYVEKFFSFVVVADKTQHI